MRTGTRGGDEDDLAHGDLQHHETVALLTHDPAVLVGPWFGDGGAVEIVGITLCHGNVYVTLQHADIAVCQGDGDLHPFAGIPVAAVGLYVKVIIVARQLRNGQCGCAVHHNRCARTLLESGRSVFHVPRSLLIARQPIHFHGMTVNQGVGQM